MDPGDGSDTEAETPPPDWQDPEPPPDADQEDGHDPSDVPADESPPDIFIPGEMQAELIATSPAGTATPPTWNAHLPKAAGDGDYLYAVHTYYPDDVASRFALVMARPASGPAGSWSEVARISYPHQPPGVIMDTASRMHLVFDCLRPGSGDVTCFQGGAGTSGLLSRFYHLVFSARDSDGLMRFDTYANHNEFTLHSNGYCGIGTTADGVTFWSLADETWQRVVQYWSGPGLFGTAAHLTAAGGVYLLYPIMAGDPAAGSAAFLVYAGEFDPSGGTNSGYIASTAYLGDTSGFSPLFRRTPSTPADPGTVGAYPSDVAHGPDGTLFVLSYLLEADDECTELLRFDGGTSAPPSILPVGCVSNYAKMQFASSGVLYLLTPGSGAQVRIGVSPDRGDSWEWHDVPVSGLGGTGDTRFFGFTPVKPYTSPLIYDADSLVVFFSGYDASNLARHSYLGTLPLSE